MTFDEIDRELPAGFHDATLERLEIDWRLKRALLDVRVQVAEEQDAGRLARVIVTGLVFCSVDPPIIDPDRGYEATPDEGLWIDSGTGPGSPEAIAALPKGPPGAFLQWIFVRQWNRFIHICGRGATLSWLEVAHAEVLDG